LFVCSFNDVLSTTAI